MIGKLRKDIICCISWVLRLRILLRLSWKYKALWAKPKNKMNRHLGQGINCRPFYNRNLKKLINSGKILTNSINRSNSIKCLKLTIRNCTSNTNSWRRKVFRWVKHWLIYGLSKKLSILISIKFWECLSKNVDICELIFISIRKINFIDIIYIS